MKLDFTGKRVLVTGGTRGIGLAIVEAFLEAGARVAVNGSSEESVNRAVAKFPSSDRVVPAAGSMATVDGCRRAVEAAQSGLGGLEVLVNNAGIWHPTPTSKPGTPYWTSISRVPFSSPSSFCPPCRLRREIS